jgi:hypothetical protein
MTTFDAPTRIYDDKLLAPRGQRLGEALIERGLINRVQLFEALSIQQRHGSRLGDALVWLGHLSRDAIEIVAAGRGGPVERYAPPITAPKKPPQTQRPLGADADATRRLRINKR